MAAAGIRARGRRDQQGQNRTFFKKSFHSLRHFFNSALLAAGVDEKTRMDLSGHASASMNRRYSHSELASLKKAVAKMVPSFPEGQRLR